MVLSRIQSRDPTKFECTCQWIITVQCPLGVKLKTYLLNVAIGMKILMIHILSVLSTKLGPCCSNDKFNLLSKMNYPNMIFYFQSGKIWRAPFHCWSCFIRPANGLFFKEFRLRSDQGWPEVTRFVLILEVHIEYARSKGKVMTLYNKLEHCYRVNFFAVTNKRSHLFCSTL